jgi:hypothetical protein
VLFTEGESEGTIRYIRENLKLYGIWKAMGYQVRFNANAPKNASVSGSMDNQLFDYLTDEPLTKNAFVCPNYYFAGWSKLANADPTYPAQQKDFLSDEEVIKTTKPLTNVDGSIIDLYVMWLPCDHDVTKDYAHYVYSVVETSSPNSVLLRQSCSCGENKVDRVFTAQNRTYTGTSHGAETIQPVSGWQTGVEPTAPVYAKDGVALAGAPTNAGTYTASVTLANVAKPDGTT